MMAVAILVVIGKCPARAGKTRPGPGGTMTAAATNKATDLPSGGPNEPPPSSQGGGSRLGGRRRPAARLALAQFVDLPLQFRQVRRAPGAPPGDAHCRHEQALVVPKLDGRGRLAGRAGEIAGGEQQLVGHLVRLPRVRYRLSPESAIGWR